jgi:hypothetical protein
MSNVHPVQEIARKVGAALDGWRWLQPA